MSWKFCIGVGVIALTIASCTSPEEELHQLFEESWNFQMQENPLQATNVGVHDYNDQLPSVTEEDNQRRLQRHREFLERLEDIPRDQLSRQDQISYDIFEQLTADRVSDLEFKAYQIPITVRSGFHISFPQLGDRMPLNDIDDYEDYISRLEQFERYSNQHINIMRDGIDRDWVLPSVVLDGIEGSIEPHIVSDPEESLLFEPFEDFPSRIDEQDRQRLKEAGKAAIMESVVPGYEQFLGFLEDEYIPAAPDDIAISSVPDGDSYYEHLVRHFTTLDMTPEEVHELGVQEVERIREEMYEVIEESDFEGTFDEFVEFLRTDPQFYADSAEELKKETSYYLKQIDGELPGYFNTLPRMPYGLKEVPDYIAPRTTTAYYRRPAGDGTEAGFYFLNTYDLPSRPLYEIEALSYHEAVPGHHLQLALQQELENIPDFRRHAGFTVFVEGWALYSERLAQEMGFYEDPYSDFGRLSYEMWRALRLVVDTGMHYLDWERQEAIDYMAENSALTMHNIRSEVDRYISWPGQALAYKIGELQIRDLRDHAEDELGGDFDIRTFHDAVLLDGSITLEILEDNVQQYIEDNR